MAFEVFGIDLDVTKFLEGTKEAKEALNKVGETDKLEDLMGTIKSIGVAAGVMGAAVLAAKVAFDVTMEAEAIRKVQIQFDLLAESAGVSGKAIKESMMSAAGGLATETDVLKSANEAMVTLGSNSNRLGDIMTLARKATSVFGGDLVTNFNNISTAIANGNVRMLRHLGLKVDAVKAEEKFAEASGHSVAALSEHGKQTALLNAVLEEGGKRFASISTEVSTATRSWKEFKVAISEIHEVAILFFEKFMGDNVRAILRGLSMEAKNLKAALSDPLESAKIHAENFKNELTVLDKQMKAIEDARAAEKSGTRKKSWLEGLFGGPSDQDFEYQIKVKQEQIARVKAGLAEAEKTAGKTEEKKSGATADEDEEAKKRSAAEDWANKKILEERLKYLSSLYAMQEKNSKENEALALKDVDKDRYFVEQKGLIKAQARVKQEEIQLRSDIGGTEKQALEIELYKEMQNKLTKLDEDRAKKRIKAAEDILAIHGSNLGLEIKLSDDQVGVVALQQKAIENLHVQTDYKLQDLAMNRDMSEAERALKREEIEMDLQLKIRQMNEETEQLKVDAATNYAKKATGLFDGIGRGFGMVAAKAEKDSKDWATRGGGYAQGLSSKFGDAFVAIGDGSKTAGEAMRSFMFGSIADIAEAEGRLMFGRSIWPPQPPGLAGGLALMTLAGYLRSQAGGSSKSGGGGGASASGATGGGASAPITTAEQVPATPTGTPQKQKSVTLQIMGNYFETQESKMKIMDMIREATDATDFKYVQIGQK